MHIRCIRGDLVGIIGNLTFRSKVYFELLYPFYSAFSWLEGASSFDCLG